MKKSIFGTALALILLAGCSGEITIGNNTPTEVPAESKTALDTLETLNVKGKASSSGYDREGGYGPAWADVDANGCDTRNDILKRDLYNILTTGGCQVESGILEDPYTGETIFFERGVDTSSEVQIDHVVALQNSWLTGAQGWDDAKRLEFANDPLNLMAAQGQANQQKGAGDTATWLPPNKSFRCTYVTRQIDVKAKYQLWVTRAEKDAMIDVLSNCAPSTDTATPDVVAPTMPAEEAPSPVVVVPDAPAVTLYSSCKEAKANGGGPYQQGVDPEYDHYKDGDADGIACE